MVKKYTQRALLIVSGILLAGTILYYNVLYDYFLLLVLFVESYILGSMLLSLDSSFTFCERVLISMALGLGIIGVAVYFLLLFGIGSRSCYALMFFIIPVFYACKRKTLPVTEIKEFLLGINVENIESSVFLICFLAVLLIIYTIYGSAPIHNYDALTKHVPIIKYAVENGKWYTNIRESVVYGETMLLVHSCTTILLSFGAEKAVVLFNVAVLFFSLFMLCTCLKRLYPECNLLFPVVILMTTPFFLSRATLFAQDIATVYFIMPVVMVLIDLDRERIYKYAELVALFCGFTLFAKLTAVSVVVVLAFVTAVCCLHNAVCNKMWRPFFGKAVRCVLLAVSPFLVSVLHIWFITGNPFFPFYNGVFKSPYYKQTNFTDPFTNKLTLSIKSFVDIIFHTSQNMEIGDLGLGVFLCFLVLTPAACYILHKRYHDNRLILWSMIALICYGVCTLTTYNLRYYILVWILFVVVVSCTISVCIQLLPQKAVRGCCGILIFVLLLAPNIHYIKTYLPIGDVLVKNEKFVENAYCNILDSVPDQKRVFGITNTNQFKGEHNIFYSSTTWHNGVLNLVLSGKYTWEQYLSSFDYIVLDKTMDVNRVDPDIVQIATPLLGPVISENESCILYSVIPKKDMVAEKTYEDYQLCSVAEPITEVFENDKDTYYISHTVDGGKLSDDGELEDGDGGQELSMRYQINWMSEDDRLIDVTILTYEVLPGVKTYDSPAIAANEKAAYGILYVCSTTEDYAKIKSYCLEGVENINVTEEEDFKRRIKLK